MESATDALRDVLWTQMTVAVTWSSTRTVIGRTAAPHPKLVAIGRDEWQSAAHYMLEAFMLDLGERQDASRDRRVNAWPSTLEALHASSQVKQRSHRRHLGST